MKAPLRLTAQDDFSFLDESSFSSYYSIQDGENCVRFLVDGISCSKCLRKIENLAGSTKGLLSIRVEMGKNLVYATFDRKQINPSVIAEKISSLGFKVHALQADSDVETASRTQSRRMLIRLAVAAVCTGNIMGFAFAIYSGSEGLWLKIFSWLSFAIYLPVVTYVAWPFYRGAWFSLRQGRLSIDLPMSVASLAGFVFSTIQLFKGETDFYFDSISGFLFLILLARFFQQRMQRRYLNSSTLTEDLQRVRRLTDTEWKWVPTHQLVINDEILVKSGDTVPIEGRLLSTRAYLSLAWLTGESQPRLLYSGSTVPAGSKVIGEDIRLLFTRPLDKTDFGRTLNQAQMHALSQNHAITAADRGTQWLLGIVFSLALIFLISYWSISPTDAIHRALALIIIACPCAMAFGTPLALTFALKKAKDAGLFITDANVFESANNIKNIYFDKTGTLTDTDLSLTTPLSQIPQVYQKIVLALENSSYHPIAFAFRKDLPPPTAMPPVASWSEVIGKGVSGYVYGKHYRLGKAIDSNHITPSCVLYEDERPVIQFHFTANLKPDVELTLTQLRSSGYRLYLLSGDNELISQELGQRLGFSQEEIHANLSPAQKAEYIASSTNVMMVGDGVNDAHAMMKADVGIAVAGAVGTALKSAKVYLSNENLSTLIEFFHIANSGTRLMRQNLALSVVYNSLGAILALNGFINPLVAALLMPASSGLILLNTWRWGRL